MERELARLGYRRLGCVEKGVVRDFIQFVTGLSVAQVGRRMRQYVETGRVCDLCASNSGRPFERVYTRRAILLLGCIRNYVSGATLVVNGPPLPTG